ncbi:MAG: glutamine-hydrolyzing GMP synthase [Pseudomonadota bacterium]
MSTHQQKILILDFGSQYTQLIARRVRECGVYCEIHPYDLAEAAIQAYHPNGIILSGGPETTTQADTPKAPEIIFQLNCPILGICYGMQTMAKQLGGQVHTATKREFGHAQLELHQHSDLFNHIEDTADTEGKALLDVWMSHGDKVEQLPPEFVVIAQTTNAPIAAMANVEKQFYGLQFHPEVTHTRQGQRIIKRFVRRICHCDDLWNPKSIVAEAIAEIKAKVGNDKVILGLSGGVDSSVTALLLQQAIGDQLTCIFVNNGLLRLHEAEEVQSMFASHFGVNLHYVDAEQQFLTALEGVADPEAKRKIIGHEFIKVFETEANNIQAVKWLAQGTIYPDVIESAGSKTKKAKVIKSHHNVGGLPETMQLQLLEPLRELFKDEVRKIGLELGLPYKMLYRHPFPGPGLGVRILGEVKKTYADKLRQADTIFIESLYADDLYDKVAQAFAVFLPVKSVGVVGDARQHEPVIALRAVETTDFMTARWARLPYEFLAKVSNRIINEVAGISRVVYDISGKPPATIEWE